MGEAKLKRFANVAAVLSATVAFGAGAANAAPSYPTSTEPALLTPWLTANTDLQASRVVINGPVHVVAVSPARGSRAGIQKATVDGEVVDAEWAQQHGFVSWRTDVEVDCSGNRVRSPTGQSYPERRRRGPQAAVFASADWTTPMQGDAIYDVVQALCRDDFRWPLRTGARAAPVSAPGPVRSVGTPDASRTPLAPTPAASPVGGRGGAYAVQVAAGPSSAAAKAELDRLAGIFSSEVRGLSRRVAPVTSNGKTFYRAMFGGLSSAKEAEQLCRTISRLGPGCLVRKP